MPDDFTSIGQTNLNFKVSPEMHRAYKTTASLKGIPMKDLLEASFECWQETFGDEQTRNLMPKRWAKSRLISPRCRGFLDC
jgi:hypothetical protein